MSYAERALRTLSAGNRALLRAENEDALLREMCRVIVEVGGYRMAWVGYAENDPGKTIRPMAFHGFEDGLLSLQRLSWADDAQGLIAQAIRQGQPRIVQSAAEARQQPQHQLALEEQIKRGYKSGALLPLHIEGRVGGLLTIYAAEPDAFDEAEANLLAEMADDLAFGIATLRMRARHREAEETIHRLAWYDTLTGLPNRTSLADQLTALITQAHTTHHSFAVTLVKIGRFPEISDTLGYAEGDLLMCDMARRLRQSAAADVSVFRVADDEFALVFPRASAESAAYAAARLLRETGQAASVDGMSVDPHVYIGIALYPGHGATPDVLLRRAKIAAAQARVTADKIAVYQGGIDQEYKRRMALMSDLAKAVDSGQLALYCQPKVSIATSRLCGAEALVRWCHPEHGMIATDDFIALAEHTGLMLPITRWVLEAAFQQSYAWFEEGLRQPLSINLSAQDLRDPKLLERITGLFSTWPVPAELVQFELTESALMEDPGGALATLSRLKDIGAKLYIDDFGTGYSSLSYLQRLPVDALKIDQSFVGEMVGSKGAAAIVRSTIELAHSLDLTVVAEGVETQAQWNALDALGCDTAQGYLVSKPMPIETFGEWFGRSSWQDAPDGRPAH